MNERGSTDGLGPGGCAFCTLLELPFQRPTRDLDVPPSVSRREVHAICWASCTPRASSGASVTSTCVRAAYECCLHGTRGATRQPPLDGRRRHNEPPEPAARASAHLHAERGLRRPHRPRRRSHMEEPHVHLHGAQLQPHPAALCMPPCTSPCTPPCTSSAAPEPRALEHHITPSRRARRSRSCCQAAR